MLYSLYFFFLFFVLRALSCSHHLFSSSKKTKNIRERIDHFLIILYSHIIIFSNNSITNSDLTSFETLKNLKIVLDYYTIRIKELFALEKSKRKKKKSSSLLCANVINQQLNQEIIGYITICLDDDGQLCPDVNIKIDIIL